MSRRVGVGAEKRISLLPNIKCDFENLGSEKPAGKHRRQTDRQLVVQRVSQPPKREIDYSREREALVLVLRKRKLMTISKTLSASVQIAQ